MQSKSIIWKNNTIIPPKLFECVSENVYRSNLVTEENILFLQTIQLKMVILLGDAHLDDTVSAYFHSFEIQIVRIPDSTNDHDWKPIQDDSVKCALKLIQNPENRPVLIMCSDGVSKTGVVIGCYRKLQHWCLTSIIQEYRRISREIKEDPNAELYIELFPPELITYSV